MALQTPLRSAEPNALSNDPTSKISANTSSVRRSGRHMAKVPVTYYQPAKKCRGSANPPAKRQKISDASPPDPSGKNSPPEISATNHHPTPNTPSNAGRINPSNKSPVVTNGNKNITNTNLQTARISKRNTAELSPALYSKNPFYQSPAPAPRLVLGNETSPLPRRYRHAGIPKFTPIQIRDLLHFNSNKISRRHVSSGPRLSLPTAIEDMAVETRHLRALVRAAASHYASLPREYGDLESCLPHLYKTFIPTAGFESWMKEGGDGMRERDIHVVLMGVFEVIFLGRFSCVEAEEKIWGLLGFEEEEGGEGGEWEEEDEWEEDEEEDGRGEVGGHS